MKRYLPILCLILLGACNSSKTYKQLKKKEILIRPGVGILDFKLGESSGDEVIRELGLGYRKITHKTYSIELKYEELGLSFYYKYEDPDQKIFTISCYAPLKAVCTNGIKLNSSSMQDVKEKYGELDWFSSDGSDYWGSEHMGIEYMVHRELSLPQFPLEESLHEQRRIVKIDIDSKER